MDWFGDTFFIISTHAPLAGRDLHFTNHLSRHLNFNPRAPCGARRSSLRGCNKSLVFQPTRPLRGATLLLMLRRCCVIFQPTRPLRGATISSRPILATGKISTHAPLAGRDRVLVSLVPITSNFNPRAPCGARQQKCTNHYAHFCDNRQISDAFAQNAACQGILLLFDAGKPCGFWVRTAQVISAHLCFAL